MAVRCWLAVARLAAAISSSWPAPPARTGQQVVRELNAAGYRVRALVRDPAARAAVLGDTVEYATGDVRQRPTIDAALQGVRYAISAIGATRKDPANAPEFVDFQGVRNLADAAAAAKLEQLVIVSSAGVTQKDHPLNRMFDNVLHLEGQGRGGRARERGALHHRPAGRPHRQAGRAERRPAGAGRPGHRLSFPGPTWPAFASRRCRSPAARNRTFEVYSAQSPAGHGLGRAVWQAGC